MEDDLGDYKDYEDLSHPLKDTLLKLAGVIESLKPNLAEWMPIDEHPRDENIYILTFDGNSMYVARWVSDNNENEWFNGDVMIQPTHFMPLPLPPKES